MLKERVPILAFWWEGKTRLEGMKGKDVFKTTSKADAFNNSYLPSLHGIGGINELISTKYLENIR